MSISKGRILVVDDSIYILTTLKQLLKRKVELIEGIRKPEYLLENIAKGRFNLLIIDMNFKAGVNTGNEGLFWLSEVKKKYPTLPVIMITAYGNIDLAVQSMKRGAADFITKPWNPDELTNKIKFHLKQYHAEKKIETDSDSRNEWQRIIGNSAEIEQLKGLIRQVGPTDANILISGENGTGKNLVANEIHQHSNRRDKNFIGIDVGALSESLFESELFGYTRGAYTDAKTDKAGKLELANKGTLFLDEIANISLSQQQKLLQVIQEKKITRLGSNKEIRTDFRLICCTNRNLPEQIKKGEFREDLYYRIKTIELKVPPLRDRRDDILILANHFAGIYARQYKRSFQKLDEASKRRIHDYDWPGNVRELSHEIEKGIILSNSNILSIYIHQNEPRGIEKDTTNLAELEKLTIQEVINKNSGNLSVSAKELGISRSTLYLKIEKYDIQ